MKTALSIPTVLCNSGQIEHRASRYRMRSLIVLSSIIMFKKSLTDKYDTGTESISMGVSSLRSTTSSVSTITTARTGSIWLGLEKHFSSSLVLAPKISCFGCPNTTPHLSQCGFHALLNPSNKFLAGPFLRILLTFHRNKNSPVSQHE